MQASGGARMNNVENQYFREIFALKSVEGSNKQKLNRDGLNAIFEMVGFVPNDKQNQEFDEIFKKTAEINFTQFKSIFSLHNTSQFNAIDVKNAFALLSREYEKPGEIKIDRLKEILSEMGITDLEIVQLTTQLHGFVDQKTGYFQYKAFVDSAYTK